MTISNAPITYWEYDLKLGQTIADQDWVPLYFHRLLGSDFVAEACAAGEGGRAGGFTAMLLWFEAVKQDPAGTLPTGDIALARLAGFGGDIRGWQAVRERALYGWETCHVEAPDGRMIERLGHATVAELSVYAWNRKHGRQVGRAAANLSQVKWKVRRQMERLKRPQRLIDNDDLVSGIAEWLIRSGLKVSGDNVTSGLAMFGAATVVPMRPPAVSDD